MTDRIDIFDRRLVRAHRDRAASRFAAHDFLFAAVAARLADRLDDVRGSFPRVLDLGCRTGLLRPLIAGKAGIAAIVGAEPSWAMAQIGADVVAEAELLPFADGAFDAVMSVLDLHWANDLPGALAQIRRTLRPDGLFLAAILGGDTLGELRGVLLEAEEAVEGGASPRVSPVADGRDAGALLQRAGFALPVVDSEIITVTYADAFTLMRELRGMGETNALRERRRRPTHRATLFEAARLYRERHGDPTGRIAATFEVITMTAWAPAPGQPRALRPGSATARLADALGAVERPAGDKAGR